MTIEICVIDELGDEVHVPAIIKEHKISAVWYIPNTNKQEVNLIVDGFQCSVKNNEALAQYIKTISK